ALVRMGDYFVLYPEARGRTSPFDEECFARDAVAEHWATYPPPVQESDAYLHLLVRVRHAGLMREYVWQFLRGEGWPQPEGLDLGGLGRGRPRTVWPGISRLRSRRSHPGDRRRGPHRLCELGAESSAPLQTACPTTPGRSTQWCR